MNPRLLAGLALGGTLLLAAVLTPIVRGAALAGGLSRGAQPDRWHRRPTPAIGGVAIFLAFGITLGIFSIFDADILGTGLIDRAPNAVLPLSPWEGLLIASMIGFMVGLADDLSPMAPMTKLVGQLVAVSFLLLSGIGVWITGIYLLDAAISVFWFIGVTNAVNLLDNMDGLAGGTAAIAGLYLALLYLIEGQFGLVLVALAMVGALVGFLAHNYPPARIFMGDSGSIFLGILLSGLALAPVDGLSRSLLAVLAAPALVLAIPILDTTLVAVGRVLEGRPITEGGTDHTSHRLVALGVSEERAVWILWALAAAGGAVGILLRTTSRPVAGLMGGLITLALIALGAFLIRVRFDGFSRERRQEATLYRAVLAWHDRFPLGLLLADALCFGLAYYAAYVARWDGVALQTELAYFQASVAVLIVCKLLAFTLMGLYGPRVLSRGKIRLRQLFQANLLGTLLTLAALLLTQRVGLSRGVAGVDLIFAILLTVGVRASFGMIKGATSSWSIKGVPTVMFGTESELDLALRAMARKTRGMADDERLKPVAVADTEYPQLRGRVGGMRLYGTPRALMNAVQETGATAVVVVGEHGGEGLPEGLEEYFKEHGSLDLFYLNVELHRGRKRPGFDDDLVVRPSAGGEPSQPS